MTTTGASDWRETVAALREMDGPDAEFRATTVLLDALPPQVGVAYRAVLERAHERSP